jgi:hypothetical protein
MHPWLMLQLLMLLTLANGTPVLVKKLIGDFLAAPLDGGRNFLDGKPLLGRSKTIRGLVLSILITMGFAPILGLPRRCRNDSNAGRFGLQLSEAENWAPPERDDARVRPNPGIALAAIGLCSPT